MTRPTEQPKDSGGDPVEVHPSQSLAERQAELNGPSGSPTSPPDARPSEQPGDLLNRAREPHFHSAEAAVKGEVCDGSCIQGQLVVLCERLQQERDDAEKALKAAEAWLVTDATGSGPFPQSALNEIRRALSSRRDGDTNG